MPASDSASSSACLPVASALEVECRGARRAVYAVSLSGELVRRLFAGGPLPAVKLALAPDGNALLVDGKTYPLSWSSEPQPVDVVRFAGARGCLEIVGAVRERLVAKQELAQAEMAEIRQQSLDAERLRLARKTVALDGQPKSTTARTRTIARPQSQSQSRFRSSNTSNSTSGTPAKRTLPLASPTARSLSERDSQLSWSPVLTEHAAAASAGKPFCLDALLDRTAPLHTDRRPASASLIPPRSAGCASLPTADARKSTYHRMSEDFALRYREYVTLNKWIDARLAVFGLLEHDLTRSAPGSKAEEQLIFRVVIEERRLRDDQEYQKKIELLEECCAALMMIKARMAALVKPV